MAKKAKVYTGTEWVDLAAATTDLSQYPNMTTTPISGFRNAIINGGMDVWQRGTSGIFPTSTQPYSSDRWESYRAGYAAGLSVYRPSGPTGIQYSARVQRDSGNTSTASIAFGQSIETSNSIRFRGKTVVLSFYARSGANFSSASSLLSVFLSTGTGTDQNFRNGFTGRVDAISSSATLTTSWQRFTYTGTIGSGISQVGVQFSYTPVGTAGAADHFEITGVQLEEGTIATPFECRPIGTELALCQRYYQLRVNGFRQLSQSGQYQGSFVSTVVEMRSTPAVALKTAQARSATYAGALISNAYPSGVRLDNYATTANVDTYCNDLYEFSAEL